MDAIIEMRGNRQRGHLREANYEREISVMGVSRKNRDLGGEIGQIKGPEIDGQ